MRKTTVAVTMVLFVLAAACAQKVNEPADVQAIKNVLADFDAAWEADKIDAATDGYYTSDAMRLEPNRPALVGREAIRTAFHSYGDKFTWKGRDVAEDVRVSGDLAVVRGTGSGTTSSKTPGITRTGKSKWIAAYARQTDGSWKVIFDCINSDLPVADALPLGEDELALLQIEREWAEADVKGDAAWLDSTLSDSYVGNDDGEAITKAQVLANVKRGIFKTESILHKDLKALVFGESAVVHGLSTFKGTVRGKDASGEYRWTYIFEKRDGRWQCVGGYSKKVD